MNTAPLAAGLTKAKTNVAASMKKIGKSMTIAGAVIVASFGMAIKTAAQFEQSMANTASVAGATSEELQKMSDYARKMGEQSVFSASQAADAMYYLASAGMNTKEIMGALEGTLALAAATQSDLAYTSESVAASLSQYGLAADEAGRVSNVFAAAISGSQATMEKMTTSMSYVGPMAKSMGMTIEDTTGILMNLYNAGLDGSKAGTSLRMAFVKLLQPTEKGTEALKNLQVAVKDSEGNMRPFKDIIDDLGVAGMTTADAMDIFGIRAGPAMMALVSQGTGAIQEMTDAVTGTDKANEMAAMQIDTFQGAIKLLKSAFEELQITLVQDLMPNLKGLIEWVTEGIKKVTAWMKENPKLTETLVKVTAAVGALMLILGPLLMILPGIVAAIGALTSPITLVVAAAAALYLAFTNWDKLVEIVGNIKDKVIAKIEEWSASLNKWWDNIIENTDNKWLLVADKIIKAVESAYKWLVTNIKKWIKSIFGWWGDIEKDTDSVWSKIVNVIIDSVKAWIKFFTDTLPGWILDTINFFEDFKTNSIRVWNDIKNSIIGKVKELIIGIFGKFEELAELPKKMLEWGKSAITSFTNGIKDKMSSVTDAVKGVGNKIKDFFGFESPPKEGPLSTSDKWMPNMMYMFGKGITDNIPEVINPVQETATGIMNIFDNLKTDLKNNIIDPIVGYLTDNLANAISGLLSGTSEFEWSWKSFWQGLKDILIKAVAAMIAKLIVLAGFSWLFGLLGIPVEWIPGLNKGGEAEELNKGGEIKGFASGGSSKDTVPTMLTPGEYIISKPMVDFIKRTGEVTSGLVGAIKTGARTPTAFSVGGGVGSNDYRKSYSSTIKIEQGAIQIVTPKFNDNDAQNMFKMIERQAHVRGLRFATN